MQTLGLFSRRAALGFLVLQLTCAMDVCGRIYIRILLPVLYFGKAG